MEKGRILLMFGMSIRKFIILSALIVSGCISHPETIAIDFDSGTEDYTPLVRKILAEHPAGEVTIRFGAGNPGLRATTGRVRSVKIFCSIPEPVRPTIRPNSTNTIKKKRCRPNGSAIRLSV